MGKFSKALTPDQFLSMSWEVVGFMDNKIRISNGEGDMWIKFEDIMSLLVKLHYQGYGDDIPILL